MHHNRTAFSQRVEARLAETLTLVREIRSAAEDYVLSLENKLTTQSHFAQAALLIRMTTGLEAETTLVTLGFFTEATIQSRSLIEAMVRVCALAKEPALIDTYMLQDVIFRGRVLRHVKEMRASWDDEIPRDPSDEEIDRQIAENDARRKRAAADGQKIGDINMLEWAKNAGVLPFVLGNYPIASDALHHGPRDLKSQIHEVDGTLKVVSGPTEGEAENLLLSSCKFLFVAVGGFLDALEVSSSPVLDQLYAQYEKAVDASAAQVICVR